MLKRLIVLFLFSLPIFAIDRIVIFKEEREMHLVSNDRVVKSYDIKLSIAHNNPFFKTGPKRLRGDQKTPEGNYKVQRKVSENWSRFPPSLLINYPNKEDIAWGKKNGYTRSELGDAIQIHGYAKRPSKAILKFVKKLGWDSLSEERLMFMIRNYVYPVFDWTNGCVAISDEEMKEVYQLVKVGTPVKIYRNKSWF